MAKSQYNIDIDGYIGEGAYSKDYVKSVLDQNQNKTVSMRMSSQGGSLMHGIAIADRIGEHGDVIVAMYGFNASSATLATLKAKKVAIASNGLYLIHKVMNPVMVFSYMNADEMRQLIADLESNAQENDKLDKVIAQMYVDKTGKSMDDILSLMKKGGWLNAQEAKDWGFVDEIFKSTEKVDMKSMESKINAFGLPVNGINQENIFTNNKTTFPMKKQWVKVNAILGVERLESSEDGVYLNEVQIEQIDTKVNELEGSVNTLTTEKQNAVQAQQTAEAKVTEKDNEIAGLKEQIENLKKAPGDKTNDVNKDADKEGDDKGGDKENDFFKTMQSANALYDMVKQ